MKRHLGTRQVLFRLCIVVSVAWLASCVTMGASVGIYQHWQPGMDWDLALEGAVLGVTGSLLIWLGWFAGSLLVYLVGRIGAWIGAGFRR